MIFRLTRLFRSKQKFIFMHIPKTAGTSLRRVMEAQYPGRFMPLYPPFATAQRSAMEKTVPAMDVLFGHVYFGIHRELGFEPRYITFLRHPVNRVISFYNHNARHSDSKYHAAIREGLTLKELLLRGNEPQLNNLMVRQITGHDPLQMIDQQELLDQARSNIKDYFLYVGITEQLAFCVEQLSGMLHWKRVDSIPRENTAAGSYSQDLDSSTRSVLEQYNRLDMLLYDEVQSRLGPSNG